MRVYLSRPDITEKEINAVTEVLRSPNLSLGPRLDEFEQAFCEYIGRKHAIAVNSGTSGLFLCLKALGIGPGDEVITTPFTFIATVNCIMMTGAKPVFVDINERTLNIDPDKIESAITENTKAIMPVEVFGNPADFDRIEVVAKKHNILFIEDCCEALGSALNGKKAGTFGQMSVFAFYPNKQMTTGEGGIILTDDKHLAELCASYRNQGRGSHSGWLGHERLGYNFRLSDINCALGIVQLSRIEEFKAKRRQVAQWYQQMLADIPGLKILQTENGCDMSWFVFVIRLPKKFTREHRDSVLDQLNQSGIQASNYFPPVHLQPFIAKQFGFEKGDFPITESVSSRTIALPFYNNLPRDQVDLVCRELKQIISKITP